LLTIVTVLIIIVDDTEKYETTSTKELTSVMVLMISWS